MSNTIATRLKEERKKLNLTQQVIANKVAITRETWSRYESGKIKPGSAVLTKLAALGVDTQYILTGKNADTDDMPVLLVAEKESTYNATLQLTKQELELIRYYRKSNIDGRKTINNVAKTLAEQATR